MLEKGLRCYPGLCRSADDVHVALQSLKLTGASFPTKMFPRSTRLLLENKMFCWLAYKSITSLRFHSYYK